MLFWLLAAVLLATSFVVSARDIHVVGLFRDRAVLIIDGKRRVFTAGEKTINGVRLISASSESALIEIDGELKTLRPDLHMPGNFRKPTHTEVQITRDSHGMFRTSGMINGRPFPFLVDTGATIIAMNSHDAGSLGLDFRRTGTPSVVNTASGYTRSWNIMLKSVRVGDIELKNIQGAVLEGSHPTEILLGMSFLGQLDVSNDGRKMTLRRKY